MTTQTNVQQARPRHTPRRRRDRQKQRRRWLWGVVLLAIVSVAAAIWVFFLNPDETISTDVAGPQTVAVFPQLYRETVSGTGTLEPARSLELSFDVSGTVINLAEVGQLVTAGEVIAQLDPTSFERSVRDAQFALEQVQSRRQSTASNQSDSQVNLQESIRSAELSVQDAQRELTRAQDDLSLKQQLEAVGGESVENVKLAQDAYDLALDNVSRAQLNLETLRASQGLQADANIQDLRDADLSIQAAQLNLEDVQDELTSTSLRAPFDGMIASLSVSEGSTVSDNATVLTLIDSNQVKLEAQIDETEISRVSLGLPAEVELDAVSEQLFTGEVTTISPVARLVSNIPIFDVIITLDNSAGLMRPGMTAEAEVLIQEVENTFSVPSNALQNVRNRSYVQSLDETGELTLQPVQAVTTVSLNTIVQGNLAPGTEILLPEAVAEDTPPQTTNNEGGGFSLPFLGGGGGGRR
ncbi:MAG: efflux RND transporter periplasmic adaptor subunit [Deinococcota bacterium]